MGKNLDYLGCRAGCIFGAGPACIASVVIAAGLIGGWGHGTPPAPPTAHAVGDFQPPVIVSGQPAEDAAAYNASAEQLTDADWQNLISMGPKPIWEQIEAKAHCKRKQPTTCPAAAAVTR